MKLSIIASPNRHGFAEGTVWQWFRECILPKDLEVQLINVEKSVPPIGDRILLMGERALRLFHRTTPNLATARGSLLNVFGKSATATFDLQDAYDFKPLEAKEQEDKLNTGKDTQKTQRTNWLFWIEQDTKKLLRPTIPVYQPMVARLMPSISKAIEYLNFAKHILYLDIETDVQSNTLSCVGFAVDDGPIYVVPVYRYNHKLAYDRRYILRFFAALADALQRCTVVIHNSMFDLLYLAANNRIPFGRKIFDTMLAHKRIYSEVEKSLGHAISLWTWLPFHKDENTRLWNHESEQRHWTYNAKDVYAMREVRKAQLAYIAEHPEYAESVQQANESVYVYLLTTLTGINVSDVELAGAIMEKSERVAQLIRIIRTLTGDPRFNPASAPQLIKYFHTRLAYKPAALSDAGKPSLNEKAMYLLAIRYPNPLLQVILNYREEAKELSMMRFHDWVLPWNEV